MVNHLLQNSDEYRIAVLVNDFGELPIGKDLIKGADDELISIAGGCIFCSIGSDLSAALLKLGEMEGR